MNFKTSFDMVNLSGAQHVSVLKFLTQLCPFTKWFNSENSQSLSRELNTISYSTGSLQWSIPDTSRNKLSLQKSFLPPFSQPAKDLKLVSMRNLSIWEARWAPLSNKPCRWDSLCYVGDGITIASLLYLGPLGNHTKNWDRAHIPK